MRNKSRQKNTPLAWKSDFLPLASGSASGLQLFFAGDKSTTQLGISNMATAKKATAAAPAAAPAAKKRTPNAAFMKPLTPSAALAAVVGKDPLPRTEIISKLWVYIKANNLQDAANKRMINADAKLKEVFGKPQVSMFEMAGLIGKHVK
jgi:chromatin remodeling complex protein RSC6